MHHWIGAGLHLLGIAGAAVAWIVNTNMPVRLGPVPFVGSCIVFYAGLLTWGY